MVSAVVKPRPFTYVEYALLPSDGRVWELVDGDFHVNPAPVPFHQTVSRRLQLRLMLLLEEPGIAAVFNAPTDVILSETTTVQPDLAVISMQHRRQVSDRGIEGSPDIIVEILSSNPAYDQVLKRGTYERHGVPEYWLVDPRAGTVEMLRLDAGLYRTLALYRRDDTLVSPSFDGRISIPLGPVFAPF
ncbi:MAG: Uma2 family endonuclease [Deltaproteobacteria bacterium]|nr:Uma2 family endonuclease [Deltaproteobacteria bacterium]